MWTEIFACLTTVPLLVCCWTKVIVPCTPNVLGNLCEIFLSCLGKKLDYKYNLKDNLGLLSGALDELQAVRDDVVRRVEDEVLKGGQEPRAVVTDWLSKVHTIETNTIQLIQDASGQGTSSQDAYGHGTSSQDASGQDVAGQNTSSQYASGHGISSQDATFGCFSMDNTIQVIDEASSSGQGDATSGCFSRCFCMDNISIVSVGEKVFKRIDEIRVLSSKGTFEQVTRPAPTHVVKERDAHQIFVLDKTFEKTWESLKKKEGMGGVGKTTLLTLKSKCSMLNAEFHAVGKEIAAKCCGLPLALDVIGKTMASKETLRDWKGALEKLKDNPIDLKGTEKIFHVLKFSNDNLKDDTVKSCFEYCALFPKAYNINRDELVEYWIGERIIDDKDGRQRARAKRLGDGITDTLVEAGLLLEDDESEQKAYMHDMIGEMALWMISNRQMLG